MIKILAVVLAAAAMVLSSPGNGTRSPGRERVKVVPAVMGLGDSITMGHMSNGTGYRTRLRALMGTVLFVGSLSDPKGNRHEGHSGQETRQLTAGAAGWTAAAHPSIVLLMAGTNDMDHGRAPAAAAGDLERLLHEARRGAPIARFVLATIPLIPGKEVAVRDFNARVRALAVAERLPLAEMETAVPESKLVDGLHPGPEGYDKMAEAWFSALTT